MGPHGRNTPRADIQGDGPLSRVLALGNAHATKQHPPRNRPAVDRRQPHVRLSAVPQATYPPVLADAQPPGAGLMTHASIAAVIYAEGQGPRIDELLVDLVGRLRQAGTKLSGAIQHNTEEGDRCRCDMTLEDLAGGRLIDISERRGPQSRGCRLDSFALEEIVGIVEASLAHGPQLLVINRFGKREAEGHGFRQAIEQAMALSIPVLVAVSENQRAAFLGFAEPFARELAFEPDAILAWCSSVAPAHAGRRAAQPAPAQAPT